MSTQNVVLIFNSVCWFPNKIINNFYDRIIFSDVNNENDIEIQQPRRIQVSKNAKIKKCKIIR